MLNSYEGVGGTTFSVNFSTQKYRIFDPFFKGFFHILGVNIILGGGGVVWGVKMGGFRGSKYPKKHDFCPERSVQKGVL